jgi:glycosyltransferase involved in cell wall biosynthesis
MKRAKIFLSLSSLEGGPIPLIESMSWNCIPIATDTGFARDFIENGKNGFILPVNPTTSEVVTAIKKSVLISIESRTSVAHLTWERISDIVWEDHQKIILHQFR